MTKKDLWFCSANGDVVAVIHGIENHMTKQDVFDLYQSLPSEVALKIAYVDAIERLIITDEAENLQC